MIDFRCYWSFGVSCLLVLEVEQMIVTFITPLPISCGELFESSQKTFQFSTGTDGSGMYFTITSRRESLRVSTLDASKH